MVLISALFLASLLYLWAFFGGGIRASGIRYIYRLPLIDIWEIALAFDPSGIMFLLLIALLWPCALLYSHGFLVQNRLENSAIFFFWMNLSVFFAAILSLAANLFTLFIAYEFITLSTIPLVIYGKNKIDWRAIVKYAGILIAASMVLALPAILFIYGNLGHGEFLEQGSIKDAIARGILSDNSARILFLLLILGFAKSAIFPLHHWLPVAMVATYPVSALLHSVVVVNSGLICVYKLILYVFGTEYLYSIFPAHKNLLLLLPAMGVILGSMAAFNSRDIKKTLAYSTITQLNMALLVAFLFTPDAVDASFMHMAAHSFAKIAMFYSCGNFYSIGQMKKIYHLKAYGYKAPITSAVFVLAGLSLIGIVPFAGFMSKFFILNSAIRLHHLVVILVLMFGTVFSALYISRIIMLLYTSTEKQDLDLSQRTIELPITMIVPLLICAIYFTGFFLVQ